LLGVEGIGDGVSSLPFLLNIMDNFPKCEEHGKTIIHVVGCEDCIKRFKNNLGLSDKDFSLMSLAHAAGMVKERINKEVNIIKDNQ
jgi:hypothetical protein